MNRTEGTSRTPPMYQHTHHGSPRGRWERKKGRKKYLKKKMTKNFPNLMTDVTLHFQEAQQFPRRISSKETHNEAGCSQMLKGRQDS